jgi:hypothetical protein
VQIHHSGPFQFAELLEAVDANDVGRGLPASSADGVGRCRPLTLRMAKATIRPASVSTIPVRRNNDLSFVSDRPLVF